MKEQIVFQPNEGQKNVFQPDIEISIRQEPMSREQLKELFGIDLIDPSTGTKLTPSYHGEHCLGTGEYAGYECCCDECDHYLTCFPDWFPGAIWDEEQQRFI